jgi:hypothetical protein
MGRRCCCEEPVGPGPCPSFPGCTPFVCYNVVLSGFSAPYANLNRTWKLSFDTGLDPPCNWRTPFCNYYTGLTEYMKLSIELIGDECVLTLSVGSIAAFALNYGSDLPKCSTVFTGFSRTSGTSGACDSAGPTDEGDCPAVVSGRCSSCNCYLTPKYVMVVISGIGGTCTAPGCGGSCTNINGTYILEILPEGHADCTWVYESVNMCCFVGELRLTLISNVLRLYIHELTPPVTDRTIASASYTDVKQCLSWNDYTLGLANQSTIGCTTTGATVTITAMP